ncbi:AAA family ATPase [Phycisphaerales bacterium AB-hyl4]|uniref:AAA family ATPase n=1 Tax=Natronomicrosphaera hydrolytica TaxID=3242702 RepID=A0ABV4U4R6_9BACT
MEQETRSPALLTPEEIEPAAGLAGQVLDELDRLLLGQSSLHRMVLIGVLSRGHILFEGLPGVGKTALIKALADILNLSFSRVQFTPDLMPGDIVGTSILQENEQGKREMVFERGPVFTNILLADEINRASPKTQSALLEAMQEQRVTTLGATRELPSPFFVLASQNPIELEGTYPLPEAQVDRFLFKLRVSGVKAEVLEQIVDTRRRGEPPGVRWRLPAGGMDVLTRAMERIVLPRPVARYVARLVAATHPDNAGAGEGVTRYVSYGASPRAAIAMAEAGRAAALLSGRPTVGFEDIKAVAPAVLNHRILLNYQARFDKVDSFDVVEQLLAAVNDVGLDLPEDLAVEVRAT